MKNMSFKQRLRQVIAIVLSMVLLVQVTPVFSDIGDQGNHVKFKVFKQDGTTQFQSSDNGKLQIYRISDATDQPLKDKVVFLPVDSSGSQFDYTTGAAVTVTSPASISASDYLEIPITDNANDMTYNFSDGRYRVHVEGLGNNFYDYEFSVPGFSADMALAKEINIVQQDRDTTKSFLQLIEHKTDNVIQTDFYPEEIITSNIYYAISGNQSVAKDAKLEIIVPAEYVEAIKVSKPSGNPAGQSNAFVRVGNNYVGGFTFDELTAGMQGEFPFDIKFKEGVTPKDFEVTIDAKITDKDGNSLADANEITYRSKIDEPSIKKSVKDFFDNGHYIYAGPTNGTKVGSTDLVTIPFGFKVNNATQNEQLYYKQITITDTLPNQNGYGNGAVWQGLLDSQNNDINDGWIQNNALSDASTIVLQKTLTAPTNLSPKEQDAWIKDAVAKTKLYLQFPDAELFNSTKDNYYRNNVSMEFTPYTAPINGNPATLTKNASIEFLFDGNIGDGYLNKSVEKKEISERSDVGSAVREDGMNWTISITHPQEIGNEPIKNLKITDYLLDNDPSTLLDKPHTLEPSEALLDDSQGKRRMYYDTIHLDAAIKSEVTGVEYTLFSDGADFTHSASDIDAFNSLNETTIKKEIKAFRVVFDPSFEIAKDETLSLGVHTKFYDYNNYNRVFYEKGQFEKNKINNSALITHTVGSDSINREVKISNYFVLVEYRPGIQLKKSVLTNNSNYLEGDDVEFFLGIDSYVSDVANDFQFKNWAFVEEIPIGLSYNESATKGDAVNDVFDITYEQNYKDSGKDLVFFRVKASESDASNNVRFDWLNSHPVHVHFKLNEYAPKGDLKNKMYATFDQADAINFLQSEVDNNDFNTGYKDATILYDTVNINSSPSGSLIAVKQIKKPGKDWSQVGYQMRMNSEYEYQFSITSTYSQPQSGLVIYDVLSDIGDTAIVDNGGAYPARSSEFRNFLRGEVVAPAGFTVKYTQAKVIDPNNAGNNNNVTNLEAQDVNHQNIVWKDYNDIVLDEVTAIKIVADAGVSLTTGDEVVFTIPMRAPYLKNYDSSQPLKRGWNSFAYKVGLVDALEVLKVYNELLTEATPTPVKKINNTTSVKVNPGDVFTYTIEDKLPNDFIELEIEDILNKDIALVGTPTLKVGSKTYTGSPFFTITPNPDQTTTLKVKINKDLVNQYNVTNGTTLSLPTKGETANLTFTAKVKEPFNQADLEQPIDNHANFIFNGVGAVTNTVSAVPYLGDFELIKTVTETGDALANVEFILYKDKDKSTQEIINSTTVNGGKNLTDASGRLRFEQLKAGEYTLVENALSIPEHQKIADFVFNIDVKGDLSTSAVNSHVKLEQDVVTKAWKVNINNDQKRGELEIQKIDRDTNAKLSGSVFTLTPGPNGEASKEYVTNALGTIFLSNLPRGNYTLVEKNAPAAYQNDAVVYNLGVANNGAITVTDALNVPLTPPEFDDGKLTISNRAIEFTLGISKIDVDSGKVLAGAVFTISPATENGETTLTSNQYGQIEATLVATKTYSLIETSAPSYYTKDSNHYQVSFDTAAQKPKVVKTSGTDSFSFSTPVLTVKNKQNRHAFSIKKLTEYGDEVENVEFSLIPIQSTSTYENNANYLSLAEKALLKDIKTDSNGEWTFSNLLHGTYDLIETKAPVGFDKARPYRVNIAPDGKVVVTQQSENDAEIYVPINSADLVGSTLTIVNNSVTGKFKIKKVDADISGNNRANIAGAEFTLLEGTTSTTITMNHQGEYLVDDLKYNKTYTLKETTAPDNYIKDNTQYVVNVDQDGNVSINVDGETTPATNFDNGILYIENKQKRFDFYVLKKDEAGFPLANAKFTLAPKDVTGNNAVHLQSEEKNNLVAVETSNQGKAEFKHLIHGEYTLTEVTAPDSYKLDTTIYEVSIKPSGEITVTQPSNQTIMVKQDGTTAYIELENVKNSGRIEILKVNSDGKNLSGAEFMLTSGSDKSKVVQNGDGKYIVENLKQDTTYTLSEIKAPYGYQIDMTKVYQLTVNKNGVTTVTPSDDFDFDNQSLVYVNSVETTDLAIKKSWQDDDNMYQKRPSEVKIKLINDAGLAEQTAILNADTQWQHTFKNLQKYNLMDGTESTPKLVNYSVKEISDIGVATEDGFFYLPSYTKRENVIVIENVLIKPTDKKMSIVVNKKWADGNDVEGLRPTSIDVKLKRTVDGVVFEDVKTLTLTSDKWMQTVTGLDIRNIDNKVYTYSVEEVSGDWQKNYTMSKSAPNTERDADGKMTTTFNITNTLKPIMLSKTVKKVWQDDRGNVLTEGLPNSVGVIQIANDGVKLVRTKFKITAEDNWQVIKKLPKYRVNEDGTYTELSYAFKEDINGLGNEFEFKRLISKDDMTTIINVRKSALLSVGISRPKPAVEIKTTAKTKTPKIKETEELSTRFEETTTQTTSEANQQNQTEPQTTESKSNFKIVEKPNPLDTLIISPAIPRGEAHNIYELTTDDGVSLGYIDINKDGSYSLVEIADVLMPNGRVILNLKTGVVDIVSIDLDILPVGVGPILPKTNETQVSWFMILSLLVSSLGIYLLKKDK